MTEMRLYSEPFARTGNIAAEGYRKLLGRPALGLLQTVIREAIQNSMDATIGEAGSRILLRTRELRPHQHAAMKQSVFTDIPPDELAGRALADSLEAGGLRVFEVCDFNTSGLGGPTRADAPGGGPEDLDFVNFLRNVGAARDTHQGGGTYGYGKTSLYSLSSCSTIIVDTQTTHRGSPVRRLMACQLGAAFDAGAGPSRRRYTGRHWWGAMDESGGVDPLEGMHAAELAGQLGLPERNAGQTGTSIVIIDPLLELNDPREMAGDMVETVLWNFWPRMTRSTDGK